MLFQILFEATTIPENLKSSFDNIFTRISNAIKGETNIEITPKWVAGMMNQFHNFKNLDRMYAAHQQNGNEQAALDTKARIIARDTLAKLSLLDKGNGYLPKNRGMLSLMRQHYTDPVHVQKDSEDMAKSTRMAGAQEYEEWLSSLPTDQQNIIKKLQELNPEEVAAFKGIVAAKEQKREFLFKMHQWANSNDVAFNTLKDMELLTDEGKLNIPNIENFREFITGLSAPRLKDVISKASVYSGKKITHDAHRNKNAVLKKLEKDPNGMHSKTLKVYHYASAKAATFKDKERAFRRVLDRIGMVRDADGNMNQIGKGALVLFKTFSGKKIDPTDAINTLNAAYHAPADNARRAQKAATRGETIGKISEI